jgi:preprotein translocase subunit SecY
MIETIKRAWKIPDLRKKIIYTLVMIALFRLGTFIAVPYINTAAVEELIGKSSVLGLLNVISGNNFKNFSIFAMSITPYITASIIVNLLTIAIPSWERLSKEGETGRKKLAKYTRYAALLLSLIQAYGITITVQSVLLVDTLFVKFFVMTVVTAGTCLLLWMGESITEKGIGNGISIIIFIGIISSIPTAIQNVYLGMTSGSFPVYLLPIIVLFILLTVAGVVAVQEGTRKVPVQYAKRVVGRKVYGGRNTHLPMKVNQSGVIPIIFASTLTMFPSTLASFFPNSAFLTKFADFMSWGKLLPTMLYVLLTIAFSFFYTLVTFNPQDVADNLKQYGGFIPGIRPGAPTVQYLNKILNRLTLSGGIFLALIAIIPIIVGNVTGLNLQFGGTSLLIVVGVALETVKQLEQQMIMRNYKGFLK